MRFPHFPAHEFYHQRVLGSCTIKKFISCRETTYGSNFHGIKISSFYSMWPIWIGISMQTGVLPYQQNLPIIHVIRGQPLKGKWKVPNASLYYYRNDIPDIYPVDFDHFYHGDESTCNPKVLTRYKSTLSKKKTYRTSPFSCPLMILRGDPENVKAIALFDTCISVGTVGFQQFHLWG